MYRSIVRWVGDKPWFRPLSIHLLPRIDSVLLRAGGWRATPFATLLLTSTGHHSGHDHLAPLYYLEDGGYVVIATNYGRAEPVWSRNLTAQPVCTVKAGRRTLAARAERVGSEAWSAYLDQFAEFYPSYRDYIARAGRDVPIWKLVPLPEVL